MNPWGSGERPEPLRDLNPRPDPRKHAADFRYRPPGPQAKAFMLSDAYVRGIRGPVGSGKSTLCCAEIMRRAAAQAPGHDGIRRTRWAVVRNTQPELRTTTIKTWLQVFPPERWGKFRWSSPFTHHIKKGDIDCEVIFLALDSAEDVKKLLSLELTGGWANEARELPKAIIDGMTMRCGRFPPMSDGSGGPTWYGAIMDTNAPDIDHWWPILAGEAPIPDYIPREEALLLQRPEGWEFFTQPEGMHEILKGRELVGYEINPEAENVVNLPPGYYTKMIAGKTRTWVDIYVRNKLGIEKDGKPVYENFVDEVHVSRETFDYDPQYRVQVGIDFGLSPAAVFAQQDRDGQWRIFKELIGTDMGARKFGQLIIRELSRFIDRGLWRNKVQITGDPAGDHRGQADENTPFLVLAALGLDARPAATNDPIARIETVGRVMSELVAGGRPKLIIDPRCTMLIRACAGGYQYRKLKVQGEPRYGVEPDKNRFSHVADALQYLLLGGGEQHDTLRRAGSSGMKQRSASQHQGILSRRNGRDRLTSRRDRNSRM